MIQLSSAEQERFWAKVDRAGSCWLWRGRVDGKGYGMCVVSRDDKRKYLIASRVAWTLSFGAIPAGKLVCHHCDVPTCMRPGHLFIGTGKDNSVDAENKGRLAHQRPGWLDRMRALMRREPKLCAVVDCARPAESRGLCHSHYDRRRRTGVAELPLSRKCAFCDREFMPHRSNQIYCAYVCGTRLWKRNHPDSMGGGRPSRRKMVGDSRPLPKVSRNVDRSGPPAQAQTGHS